jgi:hypothetical protein
MVSADAACRASTRHAEVYGFCTADGMRQCTIWPLLAVLAGCGGSSPTEPGGGGNAAPPAVLQGQTISAVDGTPAPNLTVRIGGLTATTDAGGLFEVPLSPGNHRTTVRGAGVVDRETTINGPNGERARLTLIPGAFDLVAFDEMFRASNSRLQRWATRPGLVVLGTVMKYRETDGSEYEAEAEQLTESEISQLVDHLNEGLSIMTGGTYGTFDSISIERPLLGDKVNTLRPNKIVVGRYLGIASEARTIGYGQWAETANGTIVEGAMYLDRDFDRRDSRRRLLRIHELGHALGYNHVESRLSIMNPEIGVDVTDFDRHGALIAFQRPIGNRAPDVDPSSSTAGAASEGGAIRRPPIYCR